MNKTSLLAALLLAWTLLQTPGLSESLFFDTVEVSVVNVEVLVTDQWGAPVKGLNQEDFFILEDGEPVEVTNFLAVEQGALVSSPETELSPPSLPSEATRLLQMVVVVDNRTLTPQNRNAVMASLRAVIEEQLDARDRVMIVTLGDTVSTERTCALRRLAASTST